MTHFAGSFIKGIIVMIYEFIINKVNKAKQKLKKLSQVALKAAEKAAKQAAEKAAEKTNRIKIVGFKK